MSNPLKNLGLEDLQAIVQVRVIKDYERLCRDELLSIIFPLSIISHQKTKKKQKKGKKKQQVFLKQE